MTDDSPRPKPLVGIVVVNYHSPELTIGCLEKLRAATTWPADRLRVVVVDNGSAPGFAAELAARAPEATLVGTGANLGFGGGCNLGIAALADCDHVALLNNDATPEPGWLEPLVEAVEANPRVGAATPKVLLEGRFLRLTIDAPTTRQSGADPRDLGVQLCGARIGGVDVSAGVELVEGFWGWEVDATTIGGQFAWTGHGGPQAIALVPVPDGTGHDAALEVRLASALKPVEAKVDGVAVTAGEQPAWFDVGPATPTYDVVNNTGTVLLANGASADRGYLEVDEGQYDEGGEVFGWSAAAVLLSRPFLDDAGPFDDRFFLYYEDTDLSWRGRLLGWTYRYVPASIVRHAHSTTTGSSRSAMVKQLSERNRLLALVKNAPAGVAATAIADQLADLGRAAGRDVIGRLATGKRPIARHAVATGRVLAGFAARAPAALADRRRLRRRAVVAPDELFTEGPTPR
jgi:GT2 family glycosyltransferase